MIFTGITYLINIFFWERACIKITHIDKYVLKAFSKKSYDLFSLENDWAKQV